MNEAAAQLAAGVLAFAGEDLAASPDDGSSASSFADLLRRDMTASVVWTPGIVRTEVGGNELQSAVDRALDRLPGWAEPPEHEVDRLGAQLSHAWDEADDDAIDLVESRWGEPVVRVVVRTPEDRRALLDRAGGSDLVVAPTVARTGTVFAWQWPMDIVVIDGPDAAERVDEIMQVLHAYPQLATVSTVRPYETRPGSVVIAAPDQIPSVDPGAALVVLGTDDAEHDELLELIDRRPEAVLLLSPRRDARWIGPTVIELSHDYPLDAAVARVNHDTGRDITVMADPYLIGMTSIRAHAEWLADQFFDDRSDALMDLVRNGRFDQESGAGSAVADISSSLPDGPLVDRRSTGRADMAPPPGPRPPAAPPTLGPPTAPRGPIRELPDNGPDPRPESDRADRNDGDPNAMRRLWAAVASGAAHESRQDGFLRDRDHTLQVRIAREEDPDRPGVPADGFLPSIADTTVTVDVVITMDDPAFEARTRTLELPATADSEWTEPLDFRCPTGRDELTIMITVLHGGRTIQSAVLSGPVLDRPDPTSAMSLSIDVSSSASVDRPPADLSFVVTPDGRPVEFDGSDVAIVSDQQFDRVVTDIRSTLHQRLKQPTAGIEESTEALVRLATYGSLLRRMLRGNDAEFFDGDGWIHISSLGGQDLPFELIYEHRSPRGDDIEICTPAKEGRPGCNQDCPDRNKSNRVCPYAFWATSKIIERRSHTGGRRRNDDSSVREVTIRTGAMVAVTERANVRDPNVAERIAGSVERFETSGTFRRAENWTEVEEAAKAANSLIVWVTHTLLPRGEESDPLAAALDISGDRLDVVHLDEHYVNPDGATPGPVVLALGCDTDSIEVGLADLVGLIHAARAELVVSSIAPVSGRSAAAFVDSLLDHLRKLLDDETTVPFGAAMTAARRAVVAKGDLVGLALTTSGDADVRLTNEQDQ